MKHLLTFNDISEDFSLYLESEDFELNEAKESGVTASLKKKSKASGIPMGILRKVFAKGMQAWNAGHRPGVAQHQWAFGRVNSFITGAGGARKADADLWAKAKARKKKKEKEVMKHLRKFNELEINESMEHLLPFIVLWINRKKLSKRFFLNNIKENTLDLVRFLNLMGYHIDVDILDYKLQSLIDKAFSKVENN